jgi:hypothetical protein
MIIDAYAHIAYPRYGKPEELIAVWRQWKIDKGNIALPPGMPDFAGLRRARTELGDNVRLFGIPYGPDDRSRLELAELQVRFGISGMRLMPKEMLDNPKILDLLGRAGLCLMAINVWTDAALTKVMLEWLDRHPNGTIAAPHFLTPATIDEAADDPGAFRELLRHPRMHAILSRHGGCSATGYPHTDLRPWVDEVVPLLTWERVMWGSEIPVIYHRDEQVDGARDWLSNLGISMSSQQAAAYLHENAERLFFRHQPPDSEDVSFPSWVEEGLKRYIEDNGAVPVVRTSDLRLPLDLHGRLMSAYIESQFQEPDQRFQEYLVSLLRSCVD